jgi:hypothetical protein
MTKKLLEGFRKLRTRDGAKVVYPAATTAS